MAARDSKDILRSIMICVNACLEIIGRPRIEDSQAAVIVAIMSRMAIHHKRGEQPFNRRMADVFRMSPGAERKQALLSLLGLEV